MKEGKMKVFPCIAILLFFYSAAALCQACQKLNIMVPAYFDPASAPQYWQSLNTAASRLPNRVVAIANPANGPGSTAQASYTSAIAALNSSTGRTFGYVPTNYTNRLPSAVQSDVKKWFSFYPKITGIFFDEASNTAGGEAYYQGLYKFVKNISSNATVVNNPGGSTLQSYLVYNGSTVADVICTFENGVGGLTQMQSTWAFNYSRYSFLSLNYNVSDVGVSSFDYGDVIDRAYGQNYGWVYVTNDSLPNPWDTIPGYFLSEVQYIKNDNQC